MVCLPSQFAFSFSTSVVINGPFQSRRFRSPNSTIVLKFVKKVGVFLKVCFKVILMGMAHANSFVLFWEWLFFSVKKGETSFSIVTWNWNTFQGSSSPALYFSKKEFHCCNYFFFLTEEGAPIYNSVWTSNRS